MKTYSLKSSYSFIDQRSNSQLSLLNKCPVIISNFLDGENNVPIEHQVGNHFLNPSVH